jgi:aminocarboxymuconate-semialdehyde decarboxylase
MRIIDFHNHHVPARFELTAAKTVPPAQRARWAVLTRTLADEQLLLRDIREGEISARVINIPGQLIADHNGELPHQTIMAANDHVAALVARHPGWLYGLGAVDGYDGERSAREAERAIRDLGLRGIFMDCARGELMLDAPHARPTLHVAAKYGVPVFAHPVAPEPLTRQLSRYGVTGTLYARSTANSIALIALVEGGVFEQLPGLRVVLTALAMGGLAMIAGLSGQSLRVVREHVYIDTNLLHPALLRAAVDLLGAEHVLAGSDWPINDQPIRPALELAFEEARLPQPERDAIAGGNCRQLLAIAG